MNPHRPVTQADIDCSVDEHELDASALWWACVAAWLAATFFCWVFVLGFVFGFLWLAEVL